MTTSSRRPAPRKSAGIGMTQLLSVTRAAEQLDCSRGHVYGLIAAGKLRAVELAAKGTRSKTRVRAEDLEAFIDSHTRTVSKGGGAGEVRRVDGM